MAIHPVNDRFKVKLDNDAYGFSGGEQGSAESGIVVEVPDILMYLSFHSFAFEDSFAAEEKLQKIQAYYNQFLNKRIFWESYQDKGRRFKENGQDYVYLQMTDLLAYSDDEKETAENVEPGSAGGTFRV